MSIHVVIAPVGSRTAMAGSSGSDTPRENAIPPRELEQVRQRRAIRYSSDSDG